MVLSRGQHNEGGKQALRQKNQAKTFQARLAFTFNMLDGRVQSGSECLCIPEYDRFEHIERSIRRRYVTKTNGYSTDPESIVKAIVCLKRIKRIPGHYQSVSRYNCSCSSMLKTRRARRSVMAPRVADQHRPNAPMTSSSYPRQT